MNGTAEWPMVAEVADEGLHAAAELAVQVSVIVPVSERPEPLVGLYEEFSAPLRLAGWRYEFLFVAEPWSRGMTAPLAELAARGEPVRVFHAGQSVGETMLIKTAAGHCRGGIVVMLPAYRRIDARALPRLIERVAQRGADLVSARRSPREDSWVNRLQSAAFHRLIGRVAGGRLQDIGCGVRVMRREVLDEIPLYGDFARFLPLLAQREGWQVEELPAAQHAADRGARIYGPGVYLRRLIDVLNLFFLLRFTEKPLRFFGLMGVTLSWLGAAVLGVMAVQRLGGRGIADRPLLLLGVLLLVLGVQAIALGLIGEIIVHLHATGRRPYRTARPAP